MKKNRLYRIVETASSRLSDYKWLKDAGLISRSEEFFPAGVHYPPITGYPQISKKKMLETYSPPPDEKFDVYVHIPFCRKRCIFCHYPSLYGASDAEKDYYLDHLEKEIDIVLRQLNVYRIKARSILVGGGTPTDLTPKQLKRFLSFFCARLDMSETGQFNFDVDPATLVGPDGMERLKIMRDFGVDRQTIGVQSLNDLILKKMNRSHDSSVALESINNCLDLGYQVNIELIFGYPGQTIQNWIDTIDCALTTGVHEIQFYRLKIDPYGDQIGKIVNVRQNKPDTLPSAQETVLMKQIAIDLLAESGYRENLRRVFTQNKKYISKYAFNQCCNLLDEIGFGLSAFSSLHDRFILNTQYFDEYYKAINQGQMPFNRGLVRSTEDQLRWATILPLKNFSIRKRIFEQRTGMPFNTCYPEIFKRLEDFELVLVSDNTIKLTETGAFFADEIVTQFYSQHHLPLPASDYADGPLNPWNNSSEVPVHAISA
ncbi:MAG: coproporphyrinogen-III oxidase family protein [Desulfobacteraceae bacterium]|jgi:oxygen-independent coproporphyrinogen-3 oxidase